MLNDIYNYNLKQTTLLTAEEIFKILNVKANEKFRILGCKNNPHQIIKKDKYYELIDCYMNVVDKNILEMIISNPFFVTKDIYNKGGFIPTYRYPKVEKIIYNFKKPDKPATIVFFDDGQKVIVRCDADEFTREGGLAQCYLKKILGTRGNIKKLIENADIQE